MINLVNTLQWCHNECDSVSNHQRLDCLLNRSLRRRSKKLIKAPSHWPLRGESTGDRRIALTKGQYSPKWFHLMSLSWRLLQMSQCRVVIWWVFNNHSDGHTDKNDFYFQFCDYWMYFDNVLRIEMSTVLSSLGELNIVRVIYVLTYVHNY